MTDQAQKDGKQTASMTWMMRSRGDPPQKASDKVVPLIAPGTEPLREGEARELQAQQRDFSSAIELIREASEAIRFSEERAADLEQQLGELTRQATEEIARLEAQIMAGVDRLARAEDRVRAAEQRAGEAEGWLIRLHDAVFTAFAQQVSTIGQQADHRAESQDAKTGQHAARS